MPGSAAVSLGGSIEGLQLRAWVLFNGAGTILASSGVASLVRTAAGQYTLTLSNALPDAVACVEMHFQGTTLPAATGGGALVTSTTTISLVTQQSAANTDLVATHVAVFR